MRNMMCTYARRFILVVMLVGVVSGCLNLAREPVDIRRYMLSFDREPVVSHNLQGLHIKVRRFDVASLYEGRSFVYKTGENEWEYDYYHQFALSPATMITDGTKQWFAGSPYVTFIEGNRSTGIPDFVIKGDVVSLYIDMSNARKVFAVMELRLLVINERTFPSDIVYQNTYSEMIPINKVSIKSFVEAWDAAFKMIMTSFECDFKERFLMPKTE